MRKHKQWLGVAVAALMVLCGAAVFAADAGEKAEAGVVQSITLKELFDKGGILMYPLILMSIVGVGFVVYFFLALRHRHIVPDVLRDDVLDKIEAGQMADARTACGYRPCAFSEVTVAALDYTASVEKVDPQLLREMIESEGARQAAAIQSQTQYLLDVAVISPMLGLLGTVFGMMRAFNVVAFDLAKAKPMLLAAGVAEALITTAVGLIIGIPAMMFYAYFRGRSSRLVSDLEVASSQVMTAILRKRA